MHAIALYTIWAEQGYQYRRLLISLHGSGNVVATSELHLVVVSLFMRTRILIYTTKAKDLANGSLASGLRCVYLNYRLRFEINSPSPPPHLSSHPMDVPGHDFGWKGSRHE